MTTLHRRPGFDALEDRQLLSAGFFGAPQVQETLVVLPTGPGFGHGPAAVAPGGFQNNSPLMGGPSGWQDRWAGPMHLGSDGPMNPGWDGPMFATVGGAEWITVYVTFTSGPISASSTSGHSSDPSTPTASAPTSGLPAPDPDSGSDPPMPGGPMGSPSIAGNSGNGPTSGVQPFVSLPGAGDPSYSLKVVDFNVNLATPSTSAPQPSPSGVTPDRGHAELSEPAAVPSSSFGVLLAGNSAGLQVMASPSTAPASPGLGAVVASAGSVPLQATSLFEVHPLNADHGTSASSGLEILAGLANSGSGRDARLHEPAMSPELVSFAALRPNLESGDRAADGPIEFIPAPVGADLIVEGLPRVRESLDVALDQLVRQLDDLDAALLEVRGPTPIVVFSLSLLGAAASAEMARRYVRRRTGLKRGILAVDAAGRQLTMGFPELPGSWSERRA